MHNTRNGGLLLNIFANLAYSWRTLRLKPDSKKNASNIGICVPFFAAKYATNAQYP
ncbi:hypothetical protein GGU45_000170 [Niabella hirudinis]